MSKRRGYEDPYAAARFGSLWQVVVHATSDTEDRRKVYAEAHASMVKNHRWRDYRMVFSPVKGFHVGFRFARLTDWFLRDNKEQTTEGPFASKKIILRKLGARSSQRAEVTGIYTVGADYTLFTPERADVLGIDPETLP